MGKQDKRLDFLPLFQFDLKGNLTHTFNGIQEAIDFHKSNYSSLKSALTRSSCFGRKCYFSRSKDFKLPHKKIDANPLHSKIGGGGNNRGGRAFLKEFDEDEEDF